MFTEVFNSLIEDEEEIIKGYTVIIEELLDTKKIEEKRISIQNEMEVVEELLMKMVDENSKKVINQNEYLQKYNELVERYKKAQDELSEIEGKRQEQKVRKDSINRFIEELKSQEIIIKGFDEVLWSATIDNVVIEEEKTIFHFKDGREIVEPASIKV